MQAGFLLLKLSTGVEDPQNLQKAFLSSRIPSDHTTMRGRYPEMSFGRTSFYVQGSVGCRHVVSCAGILKAGIAVARPSKRVSRQSALIDFLHRESTPNRSLFGTLCNESSRLATHSSESSYRVPKRAGGRFTRSLR